MVDAGIVVPLTKKLEMPGAGGFSIPLGNNNSTENREGRAPPCRKFCLKSFTAKAIHFTILYYAEAETKFVEFEPVPELQ